MMFLEFGILIAFQGLWGVPYLIDVYQMTQVEASYLITTLAIGICISAPLFGYLSDRVLRARKPIVRLGIVFFTLMWIPLAFKTPDLSKGFLYVIYFGLGFFHGALPVSITMIQETTETDKVGITLGYTNSYLILGIAVFQPLIGWIITVMDPNSSSTSNSSSTILGYATAFQICFFCLVIASIIGFTLQETYSGSE
jgi:MFS family permease